MHLDHAWIESRIPHQGSMCLLCEVLGWDAQSIQCRATSHRLPDNPLRTRGQLGIACGIEYAAQAMAVHGALIAEADHVLARRLDVPGATGSPATGSPAAGSPAAGYLAGIRHVVFFASRLDDVEGDLLCEVKRIAGDRATALYEFDLRSTMGRLLSGRATVVLNADRGLFT